ncbi:MAG TPA: hypothetical protein VF116_10555 [Ktedonobacterales bacterium]
MPMQHDNGTGSGDAGDTTGDGRDAFDWQSWGEDQPRGDEQSAGAGEPARSTEPGAGHWVSEGGVMRWERPGEIDEAEALDAASEASSPWAKDAIELPPGAPEVLRARAARAWLLRQRTLELDAMGVLLLERRRLHEARGEAEGEAPPDDPLPLALALAEHQAAIEEYERLLAEMDEIASHIGPARVLVEFYLRVMERLAELATQPEAPPEFADALLAAQVEGEENVRSGATPPTPHSTAVWRGRAEAALQVRRRVERVTAPEPED